MERYDMEGISLGQLFWMYYLSMQDLNNNKKNLIKVEESVITVFLEAEYFMWRWKYFVGEYTSYF